MTFLKMIIKVFLFQFDDLSLSKQTVIVIQENADMPALPSLIHVMLVFGYYL